MRNATMIRNALRLSVLLMTLLALTVFVRWGGGTMLMTWNLTSDLKSACAQSNLCEKITRDAGFNRAKGHIEVAYYLRPVAGASAAKLKGVVEGMDQRIAEENRKALAFVRPHIRQGMVMEARNGR